MHHNAIDFASALVTAGHQLTQVFFWGDATTIALASAVWPRDEMNLSQSWLELAANGNTELNICIASATRRGILNEAEAKRHDLESPTLLAGFNIVGLGSLVEAETQADRLVRF